MELRTFVACTACAAALVAASGCADGTGQALTPTLPSTQSSTNADGTVLKASAPQTSAPRASVRVTTLTPQLSVVNAAVSTPNSGATLSYVFEVYEGSTLVTVSSKISTTSNAQTLWTVPANSLQRDKTYSWRARAFFGDAAGSWSDMATFRTPLPPPVVNNDGGPGPVQCGGSTGPAIIGCVGAAFPAKLVAKISVDLRKTHMEFIRDAIIATGICKGNDWARNFKRGTPVLSHDYLVERRPGQKDRGVDLASGYDDPSTSLKLTWQIKGPPDYGFPYYAKYPAVDCSGVNQN